MNGLLSELAKIVTQFKETDIGGTNTAGDDDAVQWQSMVGVKRALCYVRLSAWNASDDLDMAKLQQASDSAGTGIKDLTTSGATGDYDTDTPIDADGDWLIFDVKPSDLDIANGFNHVRFYGEEDDDTDVDLIACHWVFLMEEAYAERSGAAVAASKLYINAD